MKKSPVLIIIIILISSFALIPKIQATFSGEKQEKPEKQEKAVKQEKVVQQIIEKEEIAYEDVTSDAELVAVIAAAIAAYEGSGSASGYVVRSLKRRR